MTYSKSTKRLVAKILRQCAEGWFNRNETDIIVRLDAPFTFGICHLFGMLMDEYCAENVLDDSEILSCFLQAINFHTGDDIYLAPAGTHWDQRAMFCLILAEEIESNFNSAILP